MVICNEILIVLPFSFMVNKDLRVYKSVAAPGAPRSGRW